MPLGALYASDGTCRFRVYAPDAKQVFLELPGRAGETRAMAREHAGYWALETRDLGPGEAYRYRLDEGTPRPDPASHLQPEGVHGPSRIFDHAAFAWSDGLWRGLPPEAWILYELHVGTFTEEGTLASITSKLPYLRELGVNALELMPVCQFPGRRNWGYDGTYPFSVHAGYGGPEGLKRLVDACHAQGFAVVLDVVYNHMGPEGNYFQEFGPYFTEHYRTPWGRALNFDGPGSDAVREYFIENALYWFREFHIDGLRLDAVHQIYDTSARPFLAELAARVEDFSRGDGRIRYLVAESDLNDPRLLQSRDRGGCGLHAQWLDDFHHCVDVMLHRETSDYARDFGSPQQLLKAYREGYVYSGEYCPTRRRRFGKSSADRPGREFIVFIQNHDQVGNRLTGDRLSRRVDFESAKLAAGAMLLSPYIPLLFMGEEYGETNPFLFFADYGDAKLAQAVREGRKREFDHLQVSGELPDPMGEAAFLDSKLDWSRPASGRHRVHLEFYRALLAARRDIPALRKPDKENLEASAWDGRMFLLRRSRASDGRVDGEAACLLNFGHEDARERLQVEDGEWTLVMDSADARWQGPGSQAPPRLRAGDAVALRPRSFVLYARNP